MRFAPGSKATDPAQPSDGLGGASTSLALGCGLVLAAVAVAAFWPASGFEFLAYDDNLYVLENATVRRGLTAEGIAWAFRTLHAANWHPVTWLSHMADVQLFGLDAGRHHLVNVAFHALNTALLFAWLRAVTADTPRSALAAALFAVHPLHVESVAWVAERKDLLSTTFFLLALLAYVGYVRRPAPARYALVAGLFGLGLMSKPMVVTFPLVLLLVDVFLLRRVAHPFTVRAAWPLVAEKLPLLALSLAVGVVTLVAQSGGSAIVSDRALPLSSRAANAVVAYARYLARVVWPDGLAVLYPHAAFEPGGIPARDVIEAAAALAALVALAVWQRRRRPLIAFGLLWYAVTLLPVIGLVQAGVQGMADRYTYVPLVGVLVGALWAIRVPARPAARAVATLAALVVVAACGVATRRQLSYWRDTTTLFERTLAVTRGNWQALEILGGERLRAGRNADALALFRAELELRPDSPLVRKNLACALSRLGDHRAAARELERSIRLAPEDVDAWASLASEYAWLDEPEHVRELVPRLARIDPGKARELAERLRPPRP